MEDLNYRTLLGILLKSMITDYEGKKIENHSTRLIIGATPDLLIQFGFPQLPLMIDGRVVDKAYFDHGVPKGVLERVHQLIATPKAIFKAHQNQPGSVVVTYEAVGNSPIIIPIHPNQQKTRNEFFNFIPSIYPKETKGEPIEKRWKREGLLLWES